MVTGLLLLLATAAPRVAGQAPLLSGEEQTLLDYINGYRIENGLGPLKVSSTVTEAARGMSQDMGQNDYFSHTDSQGRSPFQRMASAGYDCEAYNTWCGENLAAGVASGAETFELWRNSPGHNGNMLNPNYVVAGVAAAFNEDSTYGWYWTLDLGGFDDSGQAPPTATPELTPTPLPPTPTPSPSPTQEPPPPPTSTPLPPAPTETVAPPTETAPLPTETPPLVTETPPLVTETPPEPTEVAPPPAETPEQSSGQQFGQAPPIREDEGRSTNVLLIRELGVGWNRLEVAGQARKVTEVLPVDDGSLRAIYAWDQGSRVWRRYLPGIGIPGVNTLTEIGANQTVWVLARRPVAVRLSA